MTKGSGTAMPNMIELDFTELPYAINEEMKTLRTNIQFCGKDKKVILLTSAVQNEGKSTLALCLCKSFAELGKRVLLIDADMRLPSVASWRRSYARMRRQASFFCRPAAIRRIRWSCWPERKWRA